MRRSYRDELTSLTLSKVLDSSSLIIPARLNIQVCADLDNGILIACIMNFELPWRPPEQLKEFSLSLVMAVLPPRADDSTWQRQVRGFLSIT